MHKIFCFLSISILLCISTGYTYRYAIIIGHNDGGKSVEKLRYAEKDANRFANLLTEFAGFEKSNIIVLLHPKCSDIEISFKEISRIIKMRPDQEDALFLLYYSGHANGRSMLLSGVEYPLQKIKQQINSITTGITISVFDACQSGTVTRYKGGKRAEPFYLKAQKNVRGQIIIASSAATELAQESDMLKGSVFTHHWINGLRGSADLSGDKKVTITEAYNYAFRKTVETTALTGGQIQHPVYKFNIHGQGNIALSNFTDQSTGVLFDNSLNGKFLILSENYTDIFADFYKRPEQEEIFISLNPGVYTAINIIGEEVKVHDFSIIGNRTYRIANSGFIPNISTLNRIKGENPRAQKILEPETVPLSIYSWGFGFRGLGALNRSLRREKPVFGIFLTNAIYIEKNLNLFINVGWIGPGKHAGLDIGFDYHFNLEKWDPLIGAGAGLYLFEREEYEINEEIGPSITIHAGVVRHITDRIQLQLQIPWTIVFNSQKDNVIGFEILMVICGKYRHVKALNYN